MTKRWNSDTGRSPSDCGDIFQQKNWDGWVVVRNQIEYIEQQNSEKQKKLNVLKKKMAEDGNNQWDGARRGKS